MSDDEAGLRGSVDQLNRVIGDLRVTVGQLGVEVHNLADREREDRDGRAKLGDRVSRLEAWKNRATGGLILISTVTVATGSVVAAWILK